MNNHRSWLYGVGSALILVLVAGCSKGGDDAAGNADGWQIPAGTYRTSDGAQAAEATRYEVHLSEGDQSPIAEISLCRPECGTPVHAAVMRGLNGVSFSVSDSGHMIDITLTPASAREIMMAADWGQGLTTATLALVPPLGEATGSAPLD